MLSYNKPCEEAVVEPPPLTAGETLVLRLALAGLSADIVKRPADMKVALTMTSLTGYDGLNSAATDRP